MAGIDGFLCEYSINTGHDSRVPIIMAQLGKKYNFQVGIHWIPINFTTWNKGINNRKDLIEAAKQTLISVINDIYNVSGIKIKNRPLILIFNIHNKEYPQNKVKGTIFSKNEINILRKTIENHNPIFLTWDIVKDVTSVVDGYYHWIIPSGSVVPEGSKYDTIGDLPLQKKRLSNFYNIALNMKNKYKDKYFLGSIWPGFDDHLGRAWGEDIARYTPRYDGDTLKETWLLAKNADIDAAFIITWNDWVESTIIEPSIEFGYKDIQFCQKEIADWKKIELNAESLKLPEIIFNLRKKIILLKKIGIKSSLIKQLKIKTDKSALILSKGNWKKCKKILKDINDNIKNNINNKIIIKSKKIKWRANNNPSQLKIILKDNKKIKSQKHIFISTFKNKKCISFFNTISFKLSDSVKKELNKKHIKGRISFTYYDNDSNWLTVIQEGKNTDETIIAKFRKFNKNKWNTVEMDIVENFIPETGFKDIIFKIVSENNEIFLNNIKLNIETYSANK